jgi:hypothetical protein
LTPICQLTTPTLKIPFTIKKNSDVGKGSVGSLATGREPVIADRSSDRGIEGGFEESNISVELG